jgi:GDP-L-fucose synthase
LFAVFGKYEDYEIRFISNAICRALLGAPVTMRQNVMFDYLYIDDFIRILDKFITYKPAEIFINIGRGEVIDLKTLAEKVLRAVGKELPVLVANSDWAKEYSCDTVRLQELVPNFSYTSIDTAITDLVSYYKTVLSSLNKQALIEE